LYKATREIVSLLFPPLFLIPEWQTTRKLVVLYSSLYTTTVNHATMVTTLLLKQLICFYSGMRACTLTTFLGCPSCTTVTKECYQTGFLN